METWDDADNNLKSLSNLWKSPLTEAGLRYENIGNTYTSYFTLENGKKAESALDHLYYSSETIFKNSRKINNSLSDHFPVAIDIAIERQCQPDQYILKRCFKNFIRESFLEDLSKQYWHNLGNKDLNVHQKTELFDNIFEACLEKHAPLKKIKIRPHYKKGLSEETLKLIKERDKARIEASKGSRLDRFILVQKYKTARNRVTSSIRKESQQAFIDNLKKSSSPSELWREVKPKSHDFERKW